MSCQFGYRHFEFKHNQSPPESQNVIRIGKRLCDVNQTQLDGPEFDDSLSNVCARWPQEPHSCLSNLILVFSARVSFCFDLRATLTSTLPPGTDFRSFVFDPTSTSQIIS